MKALLAVTVLLVFPHQAFSQIIPSDRTYAWNPGLTSLGGIPHRTSVCATLPAGDGAHNDSTRIQNAIEACQPGQVLQLACGTFVANNYVLIDKPITVRGGGAGCTIVRKNNGARPRTSKIVPGTAGIHEPVDPSTYTYDASPIFVAGYTRWPGPDESTAAALTADANKGDMSVTLASVVGLSAGQIVLLDELSGASWQPTPTNYGCSDNPNPTPCPPFVWKGDHVAWMMHCAEQQWIDDAAHCSMTPPVGPYDVKPGDTPAAMCWFSRCGRVVNELKQVASISGNVVTFTTPLSISYRVSHTAQVTQYTSTGNGGNGAPHILNVGIENLTMQRGGDGSLRFENCAFCWAKGVEVLYWLNEGIALEGCFKCEVRDSWIHIGSWPTPGGAGYAISLASGTAEALIENVVTNDTNKNIACRSSGAGSVIGYSYFDDSWISYAPEWEEVSLNCSHMAGSHHVLMEGNWAVNGDSDNTHGTSNYLVFFRNYLPGIRHSFPPATFNQNLRAAGAMGPTRSASYVGNLLGASGKTSGWLYTDDAMTCDAAGNHCTGQSSSYGDGVGDIWIMGYDPTNWNAYPDQDALTTMQRDGNWDFLTNSQRWHNTPSGFPIPNSLYLAKKPQAFGSGDSWPWTNPSAGTVGLLPAQWCFSQGKMPSCREGM
ncbi:MAG TPA: pectate lyase [Xanthobacteraceae bacterium]|nr:pectate lyase [Xanthobacteraceae bacterium]